MILKKVNWVHNDPTWLYNWIVLKGVNRVHNDKISSNGLEMSQ